MSSWVTKLVQAAYLTATVAAVCQELEKPPEERRWHGRLGLVPYDFRKPEVSRLKRSYWNPEDERVFTDGLLGVGWSINFYTLLEKMRLLRESYLSEDDFLMPTPTLRKILEKRPVEQF